MIMRELSTNLIRALEAWQQWAATADHAENGWESDAPNWDDVIEYAQALLLEPDLGTSEVSAIEEVFCLSEEIEVLADFIKANSKMVPQSSIRRLAQSTHPQVRWQVYDSLVNLDEVSRELLHQGFEDPDAYVRRRAFLRLLSIETPASSILERTATDPDPVISEHANQLLE